MWPYPGLLFGLEEYNGDDENQYTAHAEYRDELPSARAALHARHGVHLDIAVVVLVQLRKARTTLALYILFIYKGSIIEI